jgi:peptidoglycan hydrolase-like protein with peptidoglycan-binding domain
MPEISNSVGEGGRNETHDVALVQAMLRVLRKPLRHDPYYPHRVSGRFDGNTRAAIRAFQQDQGTSPPDPLGLVGVNSGTFTAMISELHAVNPDLDSLRVLPGTRMVYLGASTAELEASLKEVRDARRMGRSAPVGNSGEGLHPDFRAEVVRMIREVYRQHQIVLRGWGEFSFGRDFDGQLSRVETGSSHAQPGEGNHNFGRAMDIGFKGLRWLKDDGTIGTVTSEDTFDHDPTLGHARVEALFKARNVILERPLVGTGPFFRIRMDGGDNDPNHFQAVNQLSLYPDPQVSMARSFVGLLDRVGPLFPLGELQKLGLHVSVPMTWEVGGGHRYKCDLGFGGDKFDVGESRDIFRGRAAVTRELLARATNAYHAAMGGGVPRVHAADFSQAKVDATKQALQAVFALADDNWRDWQALDRHGNPV